MSCFAIDPDTGELLRSGGSFVRISGIDELLQNVRIRLRLFRGEVMLDQTAGARYVELVLVKGTPPARIEAEIVEQILAVPGMVSVDSITVTPDYRERTVTIVWSGTANLDDQRRRAAVEDTITLRPIG